MLLSLYRKSVALIKSPVLPNLTAVFATVIAMISIQITRDGSASADKGIQASVALSEAARSMAGTAGLQLDQLSRSVTISHKIADAATVQASAAENATRAAYRQVDASLQSANSLAQQPFIASKLADDSAKAEYMVAKRLLVYNLRRLLDRSDSLKDIIDLSRGEQTAPSLKNLNSIAQDIRSDRAQIERSFSGARFDPTMLNGVSAILNYSDKLMSIINIAINVSTPGTLLSDIDLESFTVDQGILDD